MVPLAVALAMHPLDPRHEEVPMQWQGWQWQDNWWQDCQLVARVAMAAGQLVARVLIVSGFYNFNY